MFYDKRGLPVTASSQEAVDAFDAGVEEFLGQGRDAAVLVARMDELDPDMILGQCLRGYFMRLPSRGHLEPKALDCLAKAQALAAEGTDRERKHIQALGAWCAGDLRRTNAIWEEILVDHPHDILAFRLAHFLHFFIGDLGAMLHSSARIMARWSEAVPGYGYVLGCRAFSHEENGDPTTGEPLGRRAVELNEADVWSGHAVAHCLETLGRRADGITWITAHEDAWRKRGPFANHLWWHRSLHYLELERYDEVLEAFDKQYWPGPSEDNTDITNSSSILMRLRMLGVDVGNRWESVAEVCAGRLGECLRPFNEMHFVMALAMGGRLEEADTIVSNLKNLADTKAGTGATAGDVARDVGVPVAEAIVAHARGEHARVVETMMKARYNMVPLGGSWAQRDVWIRMLINSAMADGQDGLARALLAERVADQPTSAPSWKLYADALERCGEAAQAEAMRTKAALLLAA
jgi:hypothetical protein